jgi:hypothetical protein
MKLTEDIVATIRNEPRSPMLHLFVASPNGFTFFLGQHEPALGLTTVYDWDLEGTRSIQQGTDDSLIHWRSWKR